MEWISIKDSLPKVDEKVWTFYRISKAEYQQEGWIDYITETASSKTPSWVEMGYERINVTHWMPLPDPPN